MAAISVQKALEVGKTARLIVEAEQHLDYLQSDDFGSINIELRTKSDSGSPYDTSLLSHFYIVDNEEFLNDLKNICYKHLSKRRAELYEDLNNTI